MAYPASWLRGMDRQPARTVAVAFVWSEQVNRLWPHFTYALCAPAILSFPWSSRDGYARHSEGPTTQRESGGNSPMNWCQDTNSIGEIIRGQLGRTYNRGRDRPIPA